MAVIDRKTLEVDAIVISLQGNRNRHSAANSYSFVENRDTFILAKFGLAEFYLSKYIIIETLCQTYRFSSSIIFDSEFLGGYKVEQFGVFFLFNTAERVNN